MIEEKIVKWKENGLPRKGWILTGVTDLDGIYSECDWCGTGIRYVHEITHPTENHISECGIICAEHLTQDYINHRRIEKKLRSLASKKKRRYKKFMEMEFSKSKKNNLFFTFEDNLIIFLDNANGIKLIINNIVGRKYYLSLNEAKEVAYNYLYIN